MTHGTEFQVDQMYCIILQGKQRIGAYGFVVGVDFIEMGPYVIGNHRRRTHNGIEAVVGEQTALSVQLFPFGRHSNPVPQSKQPVKYAFANDVALVVLPNTIALVVLQQIGRHRTAKIAVHLDRRLIVRERYEVPAVGRELPQITRRFLDVDDCTARVHRLVSGSDAVHARFHAVDLAIVQRPEYVAPRFFLLPNGSGVGEHFRHFR